MDSKEFLFFNFSMKDLLQNMGDNFTQDEVSRWYFRTCDSYLAYKQQQQNNCLYMSVDNNAHILEHSLTLEITWYTLVLKKLSGTGWMIVRASDQTVSILYLYRTVHMHSYFALRGRQVFLTSCRNSFAAA